MSDSEKDIDWQSIELHFRAGIRSVRDIAKEHNISHTAINKKAGAEGWVRDLSAKIKAKAQEIVSKAEVSKMVSSENLETEKTVIEVNAQIQANITLEHRADIKKHRQLRDALLNECIGQTEQNEEYERLAEIIDSGDSEKMHNAFRRAISLPQRVDSFKKLVESTKALVGLEREAFGISDNSNGDASQDPAKDWFSKTTGKVFGVSSEQ